MTALVSVAGVAGVASVAGAAGDAADAEPSFPGLSELAVPVTILVVLLLLAYFGMWRGWRRRAGRHDLPALAPVPADTDVPPTVLDAEGRYFGTTVAGDWLDRVVARGLGVRSSARLVLSEEGLDVHRDADSFRIPRSALRGARHDRGIAGKVVPPHGVLVVTWQHGDLTLDSGFRLAEGADADGVTGLHNQWIRAVDQVAVPGSNEEHTA